MTNLGRALHAGCRVGDAETMYRQAVVAAGKATADFPDASPGALVHALAWYGGFLAATDRAAGAITWLRLARRAWPAEATAAAVLAWVLADGPAGGWRAGRTPRPG